MSLNCEQFETVVNFRYIAVNRMLNGCVLILHRDARFVSYF